MNIQASEGLLFLSTITNKSIDLVLTDPPYIISRESGMNTHFNNVKTNKKEFVKTEDDWVEYKKTLKKPPEEIDCEKGEGWSKDNYLRYGTILGKKYCVQTNYGEWDTSFTLEQLEQFVHLFYQKLRDGGTCIIWFDIWKMSFLKEMMEKHKFKQIRLIEWIKTNPQPINSRVNYLTNSKEFAILGVKKGKPTFNSHQDNGIYSFPLAGGKNRFHPTQKNLKLFEALIEKHSNNGDTVIDPFLGGGTTAIACHNLHRRCFACDINQAYIDKVNVIIDVLYNA